MKSKNPPKKSKDILSEEDKFRIALEAYKRTVQNPIFQDSNNQLQFGKYAESKGNYNVDILSKELSNNGYFNETFINSESPYINNDGVNKTYSKELKGGGKLTDGGDEDEYRIALEAYKRTVSNPVFWNSKNKEYFGKYAESQALENINKLNKELDTKGYFNETGINSQSFNAPYVTNNRIYSKGSTPEFKGGGNFGQWVSDNKGYIVGGAQVLGGAALLATGNPMGAGLIAGGIQSGIGEYQSDQQAAEEAKSAENNQPVSQPLINNVVMAKQGGNLTELKTGETHAQAHANGRQSIPLGNVSVEKGETISNESDPHVHSNAFKISRKDAKDYGLLSKAIGKTPAQYSSHLSKMFSRDNDKFEQKDFESLMTNLERLSADKGKKNNRMMRYGGRLYEAEDGVKIPGLGDSITHMNGWFYDNNTGSFLTGDDHRNALNIYNQYYNDLAKVKGGFNIRGILKNKPSITTEGTVAEMNRPEFIPGEVPSSGTANINKSSTANSGPLFQTTDIARLGAIGADAYYSFKNNKRPLESDYDYQPITPNRIGYNDVSAQPYLDRNESTYRGALAALNESAGGSSSRMRAGALAAMGQKAGLDAEAITRVQNLNTQNRLAVDTTNSRENLMAQQYNSQMDYQQGLNYLADLDTYRQRNADTIGRLSSSLLQGATEIDYRDIANKATPEYDRKANLKR